MRLKNCFDIVLITLGAKIMQGFAIAILFFQSINKTTRWQCVRLITQFILIPLLKGYELFFEIVFEARHRHVVRLQRY